MIANTHYNTIDTMILGFGQDFWKVLTDILFSGLHSNEKISGYANQNIRVGISVRMETHRLYSEKLANSVKWNLLEEWYEEQNGKQLILPFPIKFTLCELFMWAITECHVSEDWGYGFKMRK